jgi:hypothetical protein
VAPLSRTVSNTLARHLTLLSIFAVVAVGSCLQREACAGLTVSLTSATPMVDFSFVPDEQSSSSAPATPSSDSNANRDGDGKIAQWLMLPRLADTGGTSVPLNGAASAVSPAAAVLDLPIRVPVESSFHYLRETTPQLQQPANRELLDPPKHGC